MALAKETESLTKRLVRTGSVNGTAGEADIADEIYGYFSALPYFQAHPENLWTTPLAGDKLARKNVFALVRGEKAGSANTVILHGHTDTVGIEDFGALSPWAFEPDALAEKLRARPLPASVAVDLASGDWLFGRGALDMKSGVAVHMTVLKALSESCGALQGNVLFMANPVEENQHTGMIEALPVLADLMESRGLQYAAAINNDYVAPLYEGDPNRYFYMGAIGKLLACFYVVGKETHAGQCFEGLDPTLLSAELTRLIDLNVDFCDAFAGALTPPPTVLKATDLKTSYNVQTPLASFLYFNFFVNHASVEKIIGKLRRTAEQAVANVMAYLNEQYRRYCEKTQALYRPLPFAPRVLTFQELYEEVAAYTPDLADTLEKTTAVLQSQGADPRTICLAAVEQVKKSCRDLSPVITIFFAPPYCPHNTLRLEEAGDQSIHAVMTAIAEEAQTQYGEPVSIQPFFPCLSDSSYLRINDSRESVRQLTANFPQVRQLYPLPFSLIKKLDIPAVNFGVYGKDAHRWTERVYKPYSFGVLPYLVQGAVKRLLAETSGERRQSNQEGVTA